MTVRSDLIDALGWLDIAMLPGGFTEGERTVAAGFLREMRGRYGESKVDPPLGLEAHLADRLAQETGACRKCGGAMKPGKALEPPLVAGIPDFPGQADLRGQTLSASGPGQLVDVMKCESCGHSYSTANREADHG